jgi:hypothetical protein
MQQSIREMSGKLGVSGAVLIVGSVVATIAAPKQRRVRNIAQIGAVVGTGMLTAAWARWPDSYRKVYQQGFTAGFYEGREQTLAQTEPPDGDQGKPETALS